ncbi:efflux RND transporter permease subunit [bacterium]|nr:efflux RND transporter permease subunit [bacterium]
MKIIDISIRRHVTIAMFTLAVILFGLVGFSRLRMNLLPELSYPTITVRTDYPGAAPAEIENLISKPVEEALGVVKNVNRVHSISRSGQSDVLLEFVWGTDMDYAGLDVREKLDVLQLPLDVQRPAILRFDPSLDPILRFGFYRRNPQDTLAAGNPGDSFDEEGLKYLRRFAEEEIKKELEAAVGVAAVKISGGLEDEIQVLIDQQKLAQLKIPVSALVNQLAAENVNLSGGRLEEGTHQYLVRTINQFRSVPEIGDIIVAHEGQKPVYLRDIAMVRHGYSEREAITRFDGREAVEIAIYKEGDANTVAVAREVEKRLGRVRGILTEDMVLVNVYDQSKFINQAVNEVISAGIIGGLLAVIILYFFLRNFWSTVIISLSIPVSVIATFNLMYGADLSLNIMSLGGIALGVGMLLDNSIVVLENIARHRSQGKDAFTAAGDGASEVGMAVTASTLTTVAVFFPLVFVKGIAGQLFRDQALTVTFSLLASLVVALTLIPMLASIKRDSKPPAGSGRKPDKPPRTAFGRFMRKTGHLLFTTIPAGLLRLILKGLSKLAAGASFLLNPLLNRFQSGYQRIENRYPEIITWALNHRRSVIGIALGLFLLSLWIGANLGVELIPQLSQGEFRVEFKLPPGTPLEKTDAVIAAIQNRSAGLKGVHTLFSVAGTGNRMNANPEEGGENWGELNVVLNSGVSRSEERAIMDRIRDHVVQVPGIQYKFGRPTLFTFKTPVEIEIAGYELDRLGKVSAAIVGKMEASDRFTDVKSTMEGGHPEIQIYFDRERAAALGLAVYEVADRVVSKVRGDIATRYSWRDRKIDVLVRTREQDRNSIDGIRRLIVNPESDKPVPLEAVADVVVGTGPGEIRRVNQERVAVVTANLSFGDLGAASKEIADIITAVPVPAGIDVKLAGQNEEMQASFRSLQLALLLAVFLVYLVMASQFESFLHPFVILFTIPLALIGAVLALWITSSTISVVVFIGLILLAGIVVNNAIVLIDLINQLRARGMKKQEAILEGGRSRLRPILMTTLTTALGLLPMAMGFGEGAEVRSPMAITVIGGLTVSTLLTLVVIPVVYSMFDRKD